MSLKLVTDNPTVEISNLATIADAARKFADELDAGEHGDVTSVTVLIETVGTLGRETWGEVPTGYELVGMLEVAKLGVLDDD